MSSTPETEESEEDIATPAITDIDSPLATADPATTDLIENILAHNRVATSSMFDAERRAGAPTSTRVKIFIIAAIITILLGVIPVFLAPLLLDRTTRPVTPTEVLTALSAFSSSRNGHSAKSALVREVTAYAKITISGNTTIYALPAANSCYGVSITNDIASQPQVEPAAECG